MGFGKDWNDDGHVSPLEDVGSAFALAYIGKALAPKSKKEAEDRQGFALMAILIVFLLFVGWVCLGLFAVLCIAIWESYLFLSDAVPINMRFLVDVGYPAAITLVFAALFRKRLASRFAAFSYAIEQRRNARAKRAAKVIDAFYLKRGDAMRGPVSREIVASAIAEGKLVADDLIAADEDGPWKPLYRSNEYGFDHTF